MLVIVSTFSVFQNLERLLVEVTHWQNLLHYDNFISITMTILGLRLHTYYIFRTTLIEELLNHLNFKQHNSCILHMREKFI